MLFRSDGLMRRSQNLSDVASAGTALANLTAAGSNRTVSNTAIAAISNPIVDVAGLGSQFTTGATGSLTLAGSSVTASEIASGAVGSTQLATNAVTTAKITDGNVTTAKLDSTSGSEAVSTGRIRNGAVTDAKQSLSTVSGTAVSSTNPIVDAAAALTERPTGMLLYPWATGAITFSSSQARGVRFVAVRPLVVTGIAFNVTTASTNAENVEIAIISTVNSGYTIHRTSANTAWTSTLTSGTNTTTTGIKVLNLSSSFLLVPGTAYYAVVNISFTSGTGVSIAAQNAGASNGHSLFGATFGTVEAINASTSAAITTSTFGTGASTYNSALQPQLALRTA